MSINLEGLPQLAQDKANHYIYGGAAAVIGAALAHVAGLDPRIGAVGLAAAIGIAKEVWDRGHGGDPSVADAVATASGAIPVVVGYTLAAWA